MSDQPHILVVDDHRDIRDLLGRYLRQHEYRVTLASDGRELRKLMNDNIAPDLIVLDLMMPGEDGLSLCRWLRENYDVPVVMLTALGEETDRIIGLEMGADDYLAKPFNPRELLARIKAVMRRAQSLPVGRKGPLPGGQVHLIAGFWIVRAMNCAMPMMWSYRLVPGNMAFSVPLLNIRTWCLTATSCLI